MDKIDCMRAFRVVVDAGGFAAAAREMGLTRSTVNKHVAFLERELQTQLLARSTRVVRPTESGLAFYDRCVVLLAEYDDAVAAISQLHDSPRGTLRINAPMSFGTLYLSPVVAKFMREHEALRVELALADRLVDPIEEGFDVTIRIGAPQDSSSLISRDITRVTRLLCASPEYLATHGEPVQARELARHRCLQYGYHGSGSHWMLSSDSGDISVAINCAMWSNNGEVLRDAAVAGGGITLLPEFIVAPAIADGQLVEVLPGYKPQHAVISAIYPRHRHLSSKVRLFVDYVVEHCSA